MASPPNPTMKAGTWFPSQKEQTRMENDSKVLLPDLPEINKRVTSRLKGLFPEEDEAFSVEMKVVQRPCVAVTIQFGKITETRYVPVDDLDETKLTEPGETRPEPENRLFTLAVNLLMRAGRKLSLVSGWRPGTGGEEAEPDDKNRA